METHTTCIKDILLDKLKGKTIQSNWISSNKTVVEDFAIKYECGNDIYLKIYSRQNHQVIYAFTLEMEEPFTIKQEIKNNDKA